MPENNTNNPVAAAQQSGKNKIGCLTLVVTSANLGCLLLLFVLQLGTTPGLAPSNQNLEKTVTDAVEAAIKKSESIDQRKLEDAIAKAVRGAIQDQATPSRTVSTLPQNQAPLSTDAESVVRVLTELKDPVFFNQADPFSVNEKRKTVADFINSLPVHTRQELVSEINEANWVLELLHLQTSPTDQDSSEDLVSRKVVLDSMAENSPAELPAHLNEAFEQLGKQTSDRLIEKIEHLVNQEALFSNDVAIVNEAELLSSLVQPDDLPEVSAQKLSGLIWKRDVLEWAEKRSPLLLNLSPEKDSSDVMAAAATVHQQAQAMKAEALLNGYDVPEQLEKLAALAHSKASSAEENSRGKALRHYQAWALGEVEAVRAIQKEGANEYIVRFLNRLREDPASLTKWDAFERYPGFRKQLFLVANIEGVDTEETIVSARLNIKIAKGLEPSWHKLSLKGEDKLTKALLADLLIINLLPIDETYLERPVARFYNEAYENVWEALEADPMRLQVAKATQSIQKRKPEDLGR